jgi:hypothetical protein
MNIDQAIQELIDKHEQLYPLSCIASAIEIVLKLLSKVDMDYYDVQNNWKNEDGELSFADFHDKTFQGVRFEHRFSIGRNASFPFEELFETIESELIANRYVMISLPSKKGWHMWVIYQKQDDDFLAFSKAGKKTNYRNILKDEIWKVGGTDILVYR